MNNLFVGFNAKMTANKAVDDDDLTLVPLEADEKAPETNFINTNDVEKVSANEALMRYHGARIKELKDTIATKYNKRLSIMKALTEGGKITSFLRNALMEEEVIEIVKATSTKEDVENVETASDAVAEKGASEEELVKASLKAQMRVLKSVYDSIRIL